jgi:hypothetical protein
MALLMLTVFNVSPSATAPNFSMRNVSRLNVGSAIFGRFFQEYGALAVCAFAEYILARATSTTIRLFFFIIVRNTIIRYMTKSKFDWLQYQSSNLFVNGKTGVQILSGMVQILG